MIKKFTIFATICVLILAWYFVFPKNHQETVAISAPITTICHIDEDILLAEINKTRVAPVVSDQDLIDFAMHRVLEIPSDWSHKGLDPHFAEVSIPYFHLGENLAKGYCNEKSLVNAWVASPGHYRIMIDPRYDHIGLGISKLPVGIYVVATFGDHTE